MNLRFIKSIGKVLMIIVLLLAGSLVSAQQAKTYEEAIIMGDKFFGEHKLLDAKAYYQMALAFKLNDDYAKKKISSIVDEMSSQMESEDRYLEIVEQADFLFGKNKFNEALAEYAKALAEIPDDDYAQERIDKIHDIQINQKEKLDTFNNLLEEGKELVRENKFDNAISNFKKAGKLFPDNGDIEKLIGKTKEQKLEYNSKMEVFQEEVELANRYLIIKDYMTALGHLETALELFPDNWAVENEIIKYQPKAKKQQEYKKQLEVADELYVNRDYASAKIKYKEASAICSENSYSVDMVSRIDEQLNLQMADLDKNYNLSLIKADSLFNISDFNAAKSEYNFLLSLKPAEDYPKTKIAEIDGYFEKDRKALEAEYATILATGDSLFAIGELVAAKVKYELALTVDKNDKYPANQLIEIEIRQKAIAQQAELKSKYNAIIAEADALVVAKDYPNAINKYQEAIVISPNEEYPGKRIAEIEMVVANAAKQKEIDQKYSDQIVMAKRLFDENSLNDARSAYLIAAEIKPLEQEPEIEIAKIDSLLKQKELQELADMHYQEYVNQSDSLQKIKLFDASILAISEALKIKPDDAFANDRLISLKSQKADYEKAVAAKNAYEDAIHEADELFAEKDYLKAKLTYEKAVTFKTEETYASNRILEINGMLERIAVENTRKYNEAIVKADNYFEVSNLSEAVVQYKIASSFKPGENYPKERIAESNSRIEEKLRLVRNEYTLAIANADKFYAAKIYDKAIAAYQNANAIFPEENYPEEMIGKIMKFIEENSIVDVISQTITIASNTKETITFEPIRVNVRKSNYVFIKATNLSGDAFKIIFGYGSDKGKNGGFVVQVPEGSEQNDYIVRVGNQYKWFSEDNNWLSIYPENGDVEISFLRISKSD